jgi:hypothetical protein
MVRVASFVNVPAVISIAAVVTFDTVKDPLLVNAPPPFVEYSPLKPEVWEAVMVPLLIKVAPLVVPFPSRYIAFDLAPVISIMPLLVMFPFELVKRIP